MGRKRREKWGRRLAAREPEALALMARDEAAMRLAARQLQGAALTDEEALEVVRFMILTSLHSKEQYCLVCHPDGGNRLARLQRLLQSKGLENGTGYLRLPLWTTGAWKGTLHAFLVPRNRVTAHDINQALYQGGPKAAALIGFEVDEKLSGPNNMDRMLEDCGLAFEAPDVETDETTELMARISVGFLRWLNTADARTIDLPVG